MRTEKLAFEMLNVKHWKAYGPFIISIRFVSMDMVGKNNHASRHLNFNVAALNL